MRAQIFNIYLFLYLFLRSHHYIALAVLEPSYLPVCLTSAGIKDLWHHGESRNGWQKTHNAYCILKYAYT